MENLTNADIEQVEESGYEFDITAGFDSVPEEASAEETTADVEDTTEESTPAAEEVPTPEPEPEDRVISFKAKRDRQEVDATIKESDIPTLWQKAQNMDRAEKRASEAQTRIEELNAKLTRFAAIGKATLGVDGDDLETILTNMESGMVDTAVRSKAKTYHNTDADIAEAHVRSTLKDTIEQSVAQFGASKTAAGTEETHEESAEASAEAIGQEGIPSFAQFQADLEKLIAVRPDLKESGEQFPTEVISAYQSGVDLFTAYAAYEAKKVAAENTALKARNAVLQQNAASAKKAPLKGGVSGSSLSDLGEDKWTAGFNDSPWGR